MILSTISTFEHFLTVATIVLILFSELYFSNHYYNFEKRCELYYVQKQLRVLEAYLSPIYSILYVRLFSTIVLRYITV